MTYPVLNDYQNKPIFHHLRSYILHCLQQIYTSWPLCASMMLNEVPFSSILLNCIQLPQAYLVGQKLTQVSSRCIGYVILDKHFQSCLILDQAEVLGKRVVVQHIPLGGLLEWESLFSEARVSGSSMTQYVTNVTNVGRMDYSPRSIFSGCLMWPTPLNTVINRQIQRNSPSSTQSTPTPVDYVHRAATNSNPKSDNVDSAQDLPHSR